jgi:hypothetical protein
VNLYEECETELNYKYINSKYNHNYHVNQDKICREFSTHRKETELIRILMGHREGERLLGRPRLRCNVYLVIEWILGK